MRIPVFCALVALSAAQAATIGQIDTFEDGTTQGWSVGLLGGVHPAPPANVANGGPLGAGDNYLSLTSFGGGGAGSKMVVLNPAQWAGDYTTLGLTSITMNLRNLGVTDLSIRLYLENPSGGPPTDDAISDAVFLPAGGGWTLATFDVSEAGLTVLNGSAANLLSGVTVLRILHNPSATFPGPPSGVPAISAALGVDNICAGGDCETPDAAIPEPSTVGLAAAGLLGIALRLRRR